MATFAQPIPWEALLALAAHCGRWTAFEAIRGSDRGRGRWTCGGPVRDALGLRPCRSMRIETKGIVAAVGYLSAEQRDALRDDAAVAQIDALRDPLTGFLSEVHGFGVHPPDLTINDSWWERSRGA